MVRNRSKLKGVRMVLMLALAAMIFIPAAAVGAQEGAAQTPTEWGGQYCSEKRPGLVVIRSREEYARLAGKSADPAQAFDFQRYAVVGVFMGLRMTGGYGVEFKEPLIKDGKVIVPFKEYAPGPGRIVTQALTTPCRFKVVPVQKGQEVVLQNLLEVSALTYRPVVFKQEQFRCEIPRDWHWEREETGTSPNPYWEKEAADFPGEVGRLIIIAPGELEGEGVKIFLSRYVPKDARPQRAPRPMWRVILPTTCVFITSRRSSRPTPNLR